MISSLAALFECQSYKELAKVDDAYPLFVTNPAEWCFQLKYDGIWAKVVIEKGLASIYSKTGQLKHTVQTDRRLYAAGETVIIGEFMYGSQWAKHPDREGLVFVFDCLVEDGKDISTLPYRARKEIADSVTTELGSVFRKTLTYSVTKLGEIWSHIERNNAYEGVIVRNRTSTYFTELYKLKTEIEDDFVIIGFEEGEGKHAGRLGALILGKYNTEGQPEFVMNCGGGFTDDDRDLIWQTRSKFINKVCRIVGKARFESGALRHPNFVQFRDDKKPEDCRLKT